MTDEEIERRRGDAVIWLGPLGRLAVKEGGGTVEQRLVWRLVKVVEFLLEERKSRAASTKRKKRRMARPPVPTKLKGKAWGTGLNS